MLWFYFFSFFLMVKTGKLTFITSDKGRSGLMAAHFKRWILSAQQLTQEVINTKVESKAFTTIKLVVGTEPPVVLWGFFVQTQCFSRQQNETVLWPSAEAPWWSLSEPKAKEKPTADEWWWMNVGLEWTSCQSTGFFPPLLLVSKKV